MWVGNGWWGDFCETWQILVNRGFGELGELWPGLGEAGLLMAGGLAFGGGGSTVFLLCVEGRFG
jgi:hypothetical protein